MLAVALALAGATPAYATVYKSGTKSCSADYHVVLNAVGSGTASFYAPSSHFLGSRAFTNNKVSWDTTYQSTSWKPGGSQSLSNSTNASCSPGI